MASAETEKCRLELIKEGGVSSILDIAAPGRPKESSATLAGGGENSAISNMIFQLLLKKKHLSAVAVAPVPVVSLVSHPHQGPKAQPDYQEKREEERQVNVVEELDSHVGLATFH